MSTTRACDGRTIPFLTFPLEIRNQIYAELLCDFRHESSPMLDELGRPSVFRGYIESTPRCPTAFCGRDGHPTSQPASSRRGRAGHGAEQLHSHIYPRPPGSRYNLRPANSLGGEDSSFPTSTMPSATFRTPPCHTT